MLLLWCAAVGVLGLMPGGRRRCTSRWRWALACGAVAGRAAAAVWCSTFAAAGWAGCERQLPEALDLVARALRSGHSFASGLQMIGEEMAEPIANEFRIVADEVNFGVSLQQALTNLSERVPLTDLRYFVVAVMIQRDSGGNLTEVLGNLSRLIRERLKLLARVQGAVVGGAPVGVDPGRHALRAGGLA